MFMELKPLCASWQRYDGRELTSSRLISQRTLAHLFDYDNATMAIVKLAERPNCYLYIYFKRK